MFEIELGIDGAAVARTSRRLPPLAGRAIRLETAPNLRDRSGPVHGGALLRERRILLDCTAEEFPRILTHELFHFVWLRLGNNTRRSFEGLIAREIAGRARGELGWAAESRKRKLAAWDPTARTRRWRDYCCESFCDTAAWLYSGVPSHPEFTLARSWRERRRAWFHSALRGRLLLV